MASGTLSTRFRRWTVGLLLAIPSILSGTESEIRITEVPTHEPRTPGLEAGQIVTGFAADLATTSRKFPADPVAFDVARQSLIPLGRFTLFVRNAQEQLSGPRLRPRWNWSPGWWRESDEQSLRQAIDEALPSMPLPQQAALDSTLAMLPRNCQSRPWLAAHIALRLAEARIAAENVSPWLELLESLVSSCAAWQRVWALQRRADVLLELSESTQRREALRDALTLIGDPDFRKDAPPWLDERSTLAWRGELQLDLGFDLRVATDWDAAKATLHSAIESFRLAGAAPYYIADARAALADVLEEVGELDAAKEAIESAVAAIDHVAPFSPVASSCHNVRGQVALKMRDYDLAETSFERVITIAQRSGLPAAHRASAYGNLGIVAYQRGDLDGSYDLLRKGHELVETHEPRGPRWSTGLNNLGAVAFQRGDLIAAQEHFEDALELNLEHGQGGRAISVMNNLASIYRQRGRLAEALAIAERSLELAEQRGFDHEKAAAHRKVGGYLFDRRSYTLARQHLVEAHELAPEEPTALASLGQVSVSQQRYDEAINWFERTLELIGDEEGHLNVRAFVELEWANALRKVGRLSEARERAVAGIQRRREVGDTSEVAQALLRLAEIEIDASRWQDAEAAAREAIDLRLRDSRSSSALMGLYRLMGVSSRGRGDQQAARDWMCQAADLVDEQLLAVGESSSERASFRAVNSDVYRGCAALWAEAGRPDQALLVMNRLRGEHLRSQMAERMLDLSASVPDELRSRLMVNRRRLEQATRLASAESAVPSQDGVPDPAVMRLRTDREALYRELRRRAPTIEELHRSAPPLELADLTALVAEDSLLIWYLVEEESSWLLTLTSNGDAAAFAIEAGRERLGELSDAVVSTILSPSQPDAYREPARALGQLLLGPLARRLANGKQTRQLTIVPDGPLHRTPFGALLIDNGTERQKHLVEQTVPIVSILDLEADSSWSSAAIESVKLVALADPTAAPSGPQGAIAPLPGARREALAIGSLFDGAAVVVGENASAPALLDLASSADLLHLGIHAESSSRDPLTSALMLWNPESSSVERLEAWQIVEDVELDAQLVTLAACSTATGPDLEGEGPQGLMRTFRLIGAENVVASLWPVEDRATGELMIAFYRQLRSGSPPSIALAQAQRSLIDSSRRPDEASPAAPTRAVGGLSGAPTKPLDHPYHWAGFQLYR